MDSVRPTLISILNRVAASDDQLVFADNATLREIRLVAQLIDDRYLSGSYECDEEERPFYAVVTGITLKGPRYVEQLEAEQRCSSSFGKIKKWACRTLTLFLSPTGWLWASVLLLLALFAAYYQFESKVSLEPEPALKSESIISTPFRVKNESPLPIYNIKQEWLIEVYRMRFPGKEEPSGYEVVPLDPKPNETIPRLASSEAVTLYPFGNIIIEEVPQPRLKLLGSIDYETAIFRRHKTQSFFFEANEGADGKFYWYHTDIPTR